jgi:hypothetical protein
MKVLQTALITTALLLGSSLWASEKQDEFDPHSLKRLKISFESEDIFEERFNTLPPELVALIMSSLLRKDQVNVRLVSRAMKEIIDGYLWPQQSCTMIGKCLSSAVDTIKALPFRSLALKFKRWELEDIQSLALFTNLTTLDVGGNQIGYAGAETLAKLMNLTTLDVSYNQIGVAGVESLAKLANLTILSVGNNQIGDAGAEALAKLINLTNLYVEDNQLSNVGKCELEELSKQGVKVRY